MSVKGAGLEKGDTPLHGAAIAGQLQVVEFLVSTGDDVNGADSDGFTPLHKASYNGHLRVVQFLVGRGADVNKGNNKDWKPLYTASLNGHLEIVQYLVSKGAQIHEVNEDGWTPLLVASVNGHHNVVRYLVSKGADIEKDKDGKTPLHLASMGGHPEIVQYLVSRGVNVTKGDKSGLTPLHQASLCGHLEVVRCLLDLGADVQSCDSQGRTPIYMTSYCGFLEVAKFLVSKGGQVDTVENNGLSALENASVHGYLDMAQYLISEGAQVNNCDNIGATPLQAATYYGHPDLVRYLVSKGADVNKTDKFGTTCLHVASYKGDLDMVQFLVSEGADVKKINNQGITAHYAASCKGHLDVVQFLTRVESQQGEKGNDKTLQHAPDTEHIDPVKEKESNEGQFDKEEELHTGGADKGVNLDAGGADKGVKVDTEGADKEAEMDTEGAGNGLKLDTEGDENLNARLPFRPEVKLDNIFIKDLFVKHPDGQKSAFHGKKARECEGCHLGGGSFGEVFKAQHTVHGEVAVKVAKPGKEDQVVMYQKEAGKHVLALISSRIVAIKGFVQCDDGTCHCGLIGIVMEFMRFGSLWDFRKNDKWERHPDPWPLTSRMVYDISSGMHFMHSKNIIHRDLKLENVLIDYHLHAKIADLGLATNLRTSFGDKCWGTPSHMPPEAFGTDLPSSTKVVTLKYDVYSFAMTLYELLTGEHPYDGRGFDMIRLLKVDAKQPPCLDPVPPDTPEDLKRIMVESWSYEPSLRPDFRDITDWVEKLNIRPTHESLGYYLGKERKEERLHPQDLNLSYLRTLMENL